MNALTIDIEDWYHVCGVEHNIPAEKWDEYESRVVQNTEKILAILADKDIKATFFVLGYIANKFPHLVKEIDAQGHEIATHGFWHRLIYRQDKDAFSKDLKDSLVLLEDIIGKKILGHRAASFSIVKDTLWTLDILAEQGLRYDCSIFPTIHPRYGIADAPRFPYDAKPDLIEFPPSTIRLMGANFPIAGGFYFRFLPYFLIKTAIRRLNSQGQPAQIYVHPWEIDTQQPKLDIRFDRSFTHYFNISSVAGKLKALLGDFNFAPVKEVLRIG
ncbi:MAG: DUF3473 domain-containing protein [Candidatus Omnitrophica bacterium]|nr:DUF3473 domain-containing protein [Candidatus Omnitrophota bacterium]